MIHDARLGRVSHRYAATGNATPCLKELAGRNQNGGRHAPSFFRQDPEEALTLDRMDAKRGD